ncbi:MAG: hypothetical protein CME32_12290 [Gimesia sp.]|nr:hypothetical protein [Gimesia sp.]
MGLVQQVPCSISETVRLLFTQQQREFEFWFSAQRQPDRTDRLGTTAVFVIRYPRQNKVTQTPRSTLLREKEANNSVWQVLRWEVTVSTL